MSKNKKAVKVNPSHLVKAALEARKNAYCPYSNYPVGASVLAASGKIYQGCNVENSSYGLACCAERTAIFNAISSGEEKLLAVCVAAKSATPCGACRQVMSEFLSPEAPVFLVDIPHSGKKIKISCNTLSELLPHAFNPAEAGL